MCFEKNWTKKDFNIMDVPADGDCLLWAEAMNDGRENLHQGEVDRRRREIVDQEYNDAISSIDVNAPEQKKM